MANNTDLSKSVDISLYKRVYNNRVSDDLRRINKEQRWIPRTNGQ